MDERLEITFHNLPVSESVEAAIRERFARLERLYDRLTACRVTVELVSKQNQTSKLFDVHIDMLVPGREIVVSRQPSKTRDRHPHADVHASIKEAFATAERQLLAHKEQLKRDGKQHEPVFPDQLAEPPSADG